MQEAEQQVVGLEASLEESQSSCASLEERLRASEANGDDLARRLRQKSERRRSNGDLDNSQGSLDLSMSGIDSRAQLVLMEAKLQAMLKEKEGFESRLREAESRAEWAEEEGRRLGIELSQAQEGELSANQNFEDAMIEVEQKLNATSLQMEERIVQSDQLVNEAREEARLQGEREEAAREELEISKEIIEQLTAELEGASIEGASKETNGGSGGMPPAGSPATLSLSRLSPPIEQPGGLAASSAEDVRWRGHWEAEASKRVQTWNQLVLVLRADMGDMGGTETGGGDTKDAFFRERLHRATLSEHTAALRENRERRTESTTERSEYRGMLAKARLESLDSRDFVNVSGLDVQGRPVVSIPVANLDRSASDLDMVLRSMVLFLDPVVEVDYVLVLYLTERDGGSTPGLSVLQDFHKMLPRSYKKHMKQIFLVHASWQSKVYLNLIRPFVSSKVFKKVVHAERTEELYKHMDRGEITIPEFVLEADRALA